MQRRPVQSSALSSVGYDPDARILELEFRENGGVWQYFGFPSATFKKFINAESLGNFFATRIKGKYPELKVKFAH
ncbi:KTSC domain-containing protein [Mucilaginibacter rubeus]|uniref:KTSC domain-containing protein n=1 Tax=Mucilaginibacter rubeus TaxID=2027860 RepID=A0A5C1I2A8_9SPHI|nr:KTSC domain-containing protein [Mucilaginibacter rubeus]QEM12065.1 KTSC domain-containing protein [Mucilaginibacter rubeus]